MFTFLTRIFRRGASSVPQPNPLPDPAASLQTREEDSGNLAFLWRAVLNRDKKVAGYEFYQHDLAGTGQTDAKFGRSFLELLESAMDDAKLGKRRAFTAIDAGLLFDPLLEKLGRTGVVALVRIDPDFQDLARLAERMQALRKFGMSLGLADARSALAHPELGDCASIGFLPVDQIILPDLLESARLLGARHPQMHLCASGVHSFEEFEVCRKLRMLGFVGPFTAQRRDWQSNTIDPGTLRLCKLVNSLRAGAEMDIIIKDIKLDPLLSYRILCYANSAAIGAQRKILALKDAILLIGREPLFRWLVLLLCASAPSRTQDSALLENALARGRMMEMLAEQVSSAPPEDFFLTGVLSLLDVVLQLPAQALFDAIDLPDEVKAALLQREGPYGGLLRLVEASERIDAEVLGDLCAELGIEPRRLSEVQAEALVWARGQEPDGAEEATFELDQSAAEELPVSVPQEAAAHAATPADTAARDLQLQAAQDGDAEAQCAMAVRHARGDGVAQDLAKSLQWYTLAAQQGNAKAQWNLAVLQTQDGTARDPQQAALWCAKAAAQGFAPAQATLGLMYVSGQGVEKDLNKALELLQQAALQGDTEAQYNLGVLLEQGQAGEPNLEQAFAWLSKAAQQGLAAAQERLGLMYAIGQPMEQDMVEAHKWFVLASTGKNEAAKANLAHSRSLLAADQLLEAERRAELWLQERAAPYAAVC